MMKRIKIKKLYQVTEHTGDWEYWLFRTLVEADKKALELRKKGIGFALQELHLGNEPLWIFESEEEIIDYAKKLKPPTPRTLK